MESQSTKLDKAVKISIIAGILLVALSVVYYFVIFLPKKQAMNLEQQAKEASLANTEEAQPDATEATPIDNQDIEQVNEDTSTPIDTQTPTENATSDEQQKQADALKKQQEEQKKAEALKKKQAEEAAAAKKQSEEAAAAKKQAEEQKKTETPATNTKIAVWKLHCSPDLLPEEKEYYRQEGLAYIQKLKDEGEKILEVREEACRFVIVMEDNPS